MFSQKFSARLFWQVLHRYLGLSIALFLIVVGLTGSLLAFYPEIERAINPNFYSVHVDQTVKLDAATLAELAEGYAPNARVSGVYLRSYTEATFARLESKVDVKTGQVLSVDFDRLFLDPYTGEELGRQLRGDLSAGWTNFMSFVYQLHYALALGSTGLWLIGIVALLWTIDCFVGFYLTLPASGKKRETITRNDTNSFWQRWRSAWKIKWRAAPIRINYDVHRASGLWLFIVLLMFAWSGVYFNQKDIYQPVMQTLFDYRDVSTELPERKPPDGVQLLNWREALQRSEYLLNQQAEQFDFFIEYPISLRLDQSRGVYIYQVRTNLDIGDRRGWTRLILDAYSGEMRLMLLPSGQYTGNTITNWLVALHQGNVFGMPYRIFVCITGIIIVILSVTGVYLWLKKRRRQSA